MEKKTYRKKQEQERMIQRLHRIQGQLRGIETMITEDRYCNDILIQLSAVKSAVESLSNQLLENHLYTCVSRDLEQGNLDILDELVSIFKRFNK